MRSYYLVGILFIGLCGVAYSRGHPGGSVEPTTAVTMAYRGPAGEWFQAVRSSCNALEVDMAHKLTPPPPDALGAGYSAACFALAGRVEEADRIIGRLGDRDRFIAAGIVFDVGHPVADMGDDQSAGPIMELVLRYQPDNYMALYHAGMSNYVLGRPGAARAYLQQFLSVYHADDGWTANARTVLGYMDRSG